MTDAAAISGTFADFKLVKTRSAAQVIVEIPIEAADQALAALGGLPQPGQEKHVAVARMSGKREANDAEPIKERRKFEDLKRSQQAGMLCAEKRFQAFLREVHRVNFLSSFGSTEGERIAATYVRKRCNVNSRSQFDTNKEAAAKWDALQSEYVQWCRT